MNEQKEVSVDVSYTGHRLPNTDFSITLDKKNDFFVEIDLCSIADETMFPLYRGITPHMLHIASDQSQQKLPFRQS